MKIYSCYFEQPGNASRARGVRPGTYERLARVWERSVRQCMPQADIVVERIAAPEAGFKNAYLAKIEQWVKVALETDVPFALADVDMLMMHSVEDVWRNAFDVAVTRRDELDGRFFFHKNTRHLHFLEWKASPSIIAPVNTGVLFVRPTKYAQAVLHDWLLANRLMARDDDYTLMIRNIYKSVDQAAMGFLMQQPLRITTLPCSVWNSCESSWGITDAKIVHIKRRLRRACMDSSSIFPRSWKGIVSAWRSHDHAGSEN